MDTCKDESEESRVVGSLVGGASLQRSHSDDMSEMTMMDDNASTTSMTTLGGNNPSLAHAKKKTKSSSSSAGVNNGIPSELNLQQAVDPIDTRQANLIDEETIASHITSQLKPGGQLQPVDQASLSQKTYLPAGWKRYISKSRNRPYWKHPDWGSTWHNPGLPVAVTHKLQSTQNVELNTARYLTSNEFPLENETDDDGSTVSLAPAKKSDPTPLKRPDPTPTTAASHASHQSQPTSPNTRRISEGYQQLLAPYQSVEKSVASKALSIASSRHSKASSYGDISSKCLTQEEFAATKEEEGVGLGTPSIGNSVGELKNGNFPAEFDNAQDEVGYDEDDLMHDRHATDLNSLASDHVDVDALLTQQRNHESPMSTIRETLNESAVDMQSPSSVVSSVDFGNVDGMSHQGSDDDKSTARNSDHDGLTRNSDDGVNSKCSQSKATSESSSHETLSKSAIKEANAGDTFSDDDLDQYDNGDGGQSPMFESNVHDADDSSDDEVEVSRRQSKRNGVTVDALDLSLDLKKESSDKRRFFPPGPLCSLQFLDEIDTGDFDTPLWRRMKRKRSSYTSVKRGVS